MPPRFSSMTLVSRARHCCRRSHATRSRMRATVARHATTGAKLIAASVSSGSVLSRSHVPQPSSTTSQTALIIPRLKELATDSTSSMPRVISSPVCTRS